jgi:hypothetical protein
MSMMREWCQQVRVGGRTSENSGEFIWRMESLQFKFKNIDLFWRSEEYSIIWILQALV